MSSEDLKYKRQADELKLSKTDRQTDIMIVKLIMLSDLMNLHTQKKTKSLTLIKAEGYSPFHDITP